jgi:rfaE bifunctional protein nucleotidyltransferase chain/domain
VLAACAVRANIRDNMIVAKLKTAGELAVLRAQMHARGQKLVFTNGCFDLLHAGHVRYLQAARALGEALVVALNGDESVRALKGPDRPINDERDRAEIIAGLACVDFVTIFHEPRVTDVIAKVRPHVYAKGGDYTIESLDPEERAALEAGDTAIRILPLVPGKSTTATIAKVSS